MSTTRKCFQYFKEIVLNADEIFKIDSQLNALPPAAGNHGLTPVSPQAIAERKQYDDLNAKLRKLAMDNEKSYAQYQQCQAENTEKAVSNLISVLKYNKGVDDKHQDIKPRK